MHGQKNEFLVVWGDTVDFRQLLIGMIIGAVVGYASYAGGLVYLQAFHSGLNKSLLMGYALLFGIAGCVMVGVVAARIFKPKRVFSEKNVNLDKKQVLCELNVDIDDEARLLDTVPNDVIKEMRELGLYHLFVKQSEQSGSGK